ncbi:MAG: S24 family peptidase [Proteobacteria bacterium]|nr:S24 family peptidase [Pseudomonadota bacterium]
MTDDDLNQHRAQRLADLLEQKYDGNKTWLGRSLGYSSGAFVRQMIEGERPITEKTIAKIHELPGCDGWMLRSSSGHQPIGRWAGKNAPSTTPEAEGVSARNATQFTQGFSASAFNATHRAPVVPWGRMGVDVLSRANVVDGELAAPVDFSEGAVVWRIDDDSMSPDYNPGDFIAIDTSPESLELLAAGEAVIVETSGGTKILRYYTPMVDGHFEARPPAGSRYASLSTLQMQLHVRAVVQAHLRIRRQATTR